jgi:hypothetical protein
MRARSRAGVTYCAISRPAFRQVVLGVTMAFMLLIMI